MMKRVTVVLVMLCVVHSWAVGAELFVATDGADDAPGTLQAPLATLVGARDSIRAMKAADGLPAGGVTVWIRGGVYHLAASFQLGAEDSGTADAPIVYRAYQDEEVRISGGQGVDPSRLKPVTDAAALARLDESARGHVLALDMSAEGISDYLPQLPDAFMGFTREYPALLELFCNGDRMQLARWPNEGFAHFDEIVDTGSGLRDKTGPERPGVFSYEGDRPSRWNVDEGVWLQGFWARAYLCTVVKVGTIDTDKRQITWAVPLHYGLDTWGAKRFFALNVLEELDRPGEWYLDRKRGVLYFWPPAPPAECDLTISMLTDPIVAMEGASYVTLRGLALECGRQDAVSISAGDHDTVIGCTIRNTGRHAVNISGGSDSGVVGCDIHHTGHGGIILSGGDRKTLTPCNHYAVNNHIHHTSIMRRTHAGPLRLEGVGCRAAHNLIHHEPHSAVWFRGNDHVMEYNEIYWAHFETSEGGVFYTGRDWTYRGNVIRYNYIHDINDSLEGSPTSVNIVHLDDCVSGTSFIGNVCYRTGRGVSICGGPDNIVDNNIFVDVNPGVALSNRGLQWYTWHRREDGSVYAIDTRTGKESTTMLRSLEKVPYREAPWTKYPHLADMLDRDPVGAPWYCEVTRNIGAGGRLLTVSRGVEDDWVTVERNWDEDMGDPGFVDLEGGDLRLRDDAPVLDAIGFEPIPFDQIGLIHDDTRASWPVNPEPPTADFMPRWMTVRDQQKRMPTALPVFAAKRVSGAIDIDGAIGPDEWTPGQAGGVMVEAYPVAVLDHNASGEPVKLTSRAWIETDDEHLCVAFVNDLNPEHGVSGGRVWGKDDAVEIALAVVGDEGIGKIMILRGYTDGSFESSDEAEGPNPLVEQIARGVEYACEVEGTTSWSAEWRIPFTSIGVDPATRNPKLLFNLSARKPADNLWVMWKKGGGYTWDVKRGGFLWLAAFGDVTFNGGAASQARIDVLAVTEGMTLEALKGCEVATWSKPIGNRLTGSTGELKPGEWRDFEYSFVADRDGEVSVELMGRQQLSPVDQSWIPVWVYWDEMSGEGADLVNGGFEDLDAKGLPAGWANTLGQAFVVADAKVASAGSRCAKTWHNGRFVQKLTVKAGVPVIIRAKVRGE
jgi:hypothetical protein